MLVYFFRPCMKGLKIANVKMMLNKHLCALWQGTENDIKAKEVLAR